MSEVGHQTKADQVQEMTVIDGLRVLVALTALVTLVTARATSDPFERLGDAVASSHAVEGFDEQPTAGALNSDLERRKRQLWFAAHPLMPYPVQPLTYGTPLHFPTTSMY